MAPKIELIHDENLTLAEGPHWDHEAKVLYYIDMFGSAVLKYDPSTTNVTRVIVDEKKETLVTWVIPVADSKEKFIIGYGNKVAVLTWDGVSTEPTNLEIIVEVEHGTGNRFNDGKADPSGRLWGGTMGEYVPNQPEQRKGALYSLNNDGKSVKSHFGDVGASNGLTWSTDRKTFYYVDSYSKTIDAFDFDIDNGDISNRRAAFDLSKNKIEGVPDGMTIDKEDKLWLAVYSSGSVYRVDPNNGEILQTVKFPVPAVTSCTWGGSNLDELYVTCAGTFGKQEPRYSGRLFKVTGLGTSGYPGVPVKL